MRHAALIALLLSLLLAPIPLRRLLEKRIPNIGPIQVLGSFPDHPVALAYAPDGRHLALACQDGQLLWLSLESGLYKRFQTGSTKLNELVFGPAGMGLFLLDRQGLVQARGPAPKTVSWEYRLPCKACKGIALDPDSNLLFVGGEDGVIRALDPEKGLLMREWVVTKEPIHRLILTLNRKGLWISRGEGFLDYMALESGSIHAFGRLSAVAMHELRAIWLSEALLFSCWDPEAEGAFKTILLTPPSGPERKIGAKHYRASHYDPAFFLGDEAASWILSATPAGLRRWCVEDGKLLQSWGGSHATNLIAGALSPQLDRCATLSREGIVCIWKIQD